MPSKQAQSPVVGALFMCGDGALALHCRLTASHLVTADIRSHGVYGRGNDGLRPVPCADRAVNTYLRDGILPTTDLTCPPSEAIR
ncbi:alpha/beta hydrolase [Streptomyces flavidovirens]|uniref:Alpha/beta hydrolase n=1 Tax=Streptomyces flavidovirens TaxID=67298 RepID=A0ABW6RKS9_9ACTN